MEKMCGKCSGRFREQDGIRETAQECLFFMLCLFVLTPPFLFFIPLSHRENGFGVRVSVRDRVRVYDKG